MINNIDGTPSFLHNVAKTGNHWVELKLVGGAKSPRDAIGATVWITAGGVRQRGDVISGGSYASTCDPRLHFGLGTAAAIEKVEIRWPSGLRETVSPPPVDGIATVAEGKGVSAGK